MAIFIESGNGIMVVRGWGRRRMGSYGLMETNFYCLFLLFLFSVCLSV